MGQDRITQARSWERMGSDFNVIPEPDFTALGSTDASIIFNGVPHFAWVDSAFNGTTYNEGPFVGRWNGSELEPVGMAAWPGTTSPFEASTKDFIEGDPGPWVIKGAKLATDGTNLFLAYKALMKTFQVCRDEHNPLTCSYAYGWWIRVWKWDGASWTQLGVIETKINNEFSDFGQSGSLAFSASPSAVGSCYLMYYERGFAGLNISDTLFSNFWVCGFGEDAFQIAPDSGTSNNPPTWDAFTPTSSRAIGVIDYQSSGLSSWQNVGLYQFALVGGNLDAMSSNEVYANSLPAGVQLMTYSSAPDSWQTTTFARDIGTLYTSAVTNSWLIRDASNNYISTYGNANVPPNQWVCDPAPAARRSHHEANIIAGLNLRGSRWGVFMDNFYPDYFYEIQPPDGSQRHSPAYPSQSSWMTAMTAFLASVGVYLRSQGKFVCVNITGFTTAAGYNEGTFDQAWAHQLAATGGCDAILFESWMMTESGVRRNTGGAVFPSYYEGWLGLHDQCNTDSVHFFPIDYDPPNSPQSARYGKASFLLSWDGVHGAYFRSIGGSDPWSSEWTTDIGTPTGARVRLGNGCYTRTFTGGWVATNPNLSSQTITMNGNTYTLAATDALIHVGA